jgi:hypothetical protein
MSSLNDLVVLATVTDTDLPQLDDRREAAKALARRPVSRLLDRAFYGVFLAALQLHEQLPEGTDVSRVGLYTAGNWDPSVPVPDFASEPSPDLVERLSHFYTHPTNPTDWLRRMPNNPICNIAITTGYMGPCLHYTGDATSLSMLATVAAASVADGQSETAMLLAFDMEPGEEHVLAHEGDGTGAGLLIGRGAGRPLAELFNAVDGMPAGSRAVDALEAFVLGAPVAGTAVA